ncbi:DNA alkylation repair protein [Blautia stercoris]|uniref:DNA alkylation repair protein n=1 Tax=Blautia stercoris TaxID=871664 RepID=UPI004024CD13
MTELQRSLFELQDLKYRDFQSKLLPKTEKEKIIGVRTPILRKFAKEFAQTKEAQKFLQELPHQYYEENNLHLMLVTQIRDYKKCLKEVTQFLPYIDNWATCDLPLPKCFEKHKAELIVDVKNWIASNDTYTIRYGIGVLLRLYLAEDFKDEYPKLVSAVISDEYYVNMMIAWYFATALAKQWEAVIGYLKDRKLTEWVHRKTIQKAIESNRITEEQKAELRGLK